MNMLIGVASSCAECRVKKNSRQSTCMLWSGTCCSASWLMTFRTGSSRRQESDREILHLGQCQPSSDMTLVGLQDSASLFIAKEHVCTVNYDCYAIQSPGQSSLWSESQGPCMGNAVQAPAALCIETALGTMQVVTSAELQHAPAELLRSPAGEAVPPAVSPAGSRPQRPKTWGMPPCS